MTSFIYQAMIAGVLISLVTGPMGCLLVWRRMAYFGDSMAHSALLGIAFGLAMGWSHSFGILLTCGVFTFVLGWLEHQSNLATDTILGILAHSTLSLGLVWISLLAHPTNLESILFGDILTISNSELLWILMGVGLALGCLYHIWSKLIFLTLHEELAHAEGIAVKQIKWVFMGLLSVIVALSVQMVGILLLMALMIIPAASARQWASSPESMAIIAVFNGMASVCSGVYLSLQLDVPTAPCIVLMTSLLFILSRALSFNRN